MTFQLYEDQAEFVVRLRESLRRGKRAVLGVASPAFGKTVVASHITQTVRDKDPSASVWFVVHRKNLLRQTSKSFWRAKIEHGLITSGKSRSKMPIQVGTIGTIYSRLATLSPPRVMFVDEAHLSRGKMFSGVIQWALDGGTIVIGLTGTPIRLDGKALGDLFQDLIEAKDTAWLIEQGRLSSYRAFTTPIQPDLSDVKKTAGDYNKAQLATAMDTPTIVGDAVSHWKKHAAGMKTVCYCVNVEHSKNTAAAFNAAGVPAVHVDADTTESELKAACEGLATGRYMILCNCELVIEGFDLSAQLDGLDVTLECCILLRPTQSLARYLQMVFRALRAKPEPAVILDHAGCIVRHGLPDEHREWSLDGRDRARRKPKEDDEPDVNVTTCGECFMVFMSGPNTCPHCGSPVEKKERVIKQAEGELEEVDVQAIRREQKREQGSARSMRDLVALGARKGMRNPAGWAANVMCAREKRKPTPDDYRQAKSIYEAMQRGAA